VLLDFGARGKVRLPAGQEHGQTTPLADSRTKRRGALSIHLFSRATSFRLSIISASGELLESQNRINRATAPKPTVWYKNSVRRHRESSIKRETCYLEIVRRAANPG
jgi:hypothetical protein